MYKIIEDITQYLEAATIYMVHIDLLTSSLDSGLL